jgi:hypothetical protein
MFGLKVPVASVVSGEREAISAQLLFGGSSLQGAFSSTAISTLTAQARSLARADAVRRAHEASDRNLQPEHPRTPTQ